MFFVPWAICDNNKIQHKTKVTNHIENQYSRSHDDHLFRDFAEIAKTIHSDSIDLDILENSTHLYSVCMLYHIVNSSCILLLTSSLINCIP